MPSRSDVLSPLTTPAIQKRSGISNSNFVSPSTSRHKGMDTPVTMYMEEHDGATEKRDRRRSRALELKQTVGSPASPGERSGSFTSTTSHGLTANQLADHYTNCIKLSAENKINSKNAFGLHLIDYMSDLIKKKELENFQVASTTLDASAKIYAGRVDAIHSETYKVLSGLGCGQDKSKHAEEDDGEEGDMAVDEQAPENSERIRKKKKKKTTTVESNLKNITTSKLDLAFEVDPMFQLMSEAFDEGGTMGLLHNTLRTFDDNQELVLDSNTIVGSNNQIESSQSKPVNLSDLKDLFRGVDISSKDVCPSFSTFTFMNWDENAEDTTMHSQDNEDHAFDMNAEHEPIPEADNDNDDMPDMVGDFPDNDYAESDDDNQVTENGEVIGDGKAAEMMTSTMDSIKHGTAGTLLSVLASEPTDYSYFSKTLFRTWAGPSHWKIKPLSKDIRSRNVTEPGKKKLRKEPFCIDYDQEVDFDNLFKVSRATMLTKSTMMKHSKKKNTLPKDLHYDADKLFRLFQKDKVMIKRQKSTYDNVDDEIENYNFDNSNDIENYCPRGDEGCDDDDENGDFGFNFVPDGGSQELNDSQPGVMISDAILDGTMLTGDKLIEEPRKVAKLDIAYAKTAKKLDVKRLKKTIWNILTESEEDKGKTGTTGQTDQLNMSMNKSILFTSLLSELPNRVSGQMAENLSVPITFVCLLHLANEKNLKIEDSEMKDLIISQNV